ncbi:unnamed protein product [Cyprideis torosa]|uniref:Uncharacterized protein n=1 Tax=Cyprideis torosa TaxID=163714 RepID=A0A7R8WBN2_9CRUS|nr:unnamed protein product [Cyprideis torosa]CAG0891074.1 unnamed protein product [Cyprideis torosa]
MSLWRSEDGALVEEGGRMKSLETLPQEPGVAQPPDESEEGMPRLIPLKPVFRRYRPEFHLFFDEESRMGKRENNRVPSLSVTNPIDVLRRKLLLSMAKEREARRSQSSGWSLGLWHLISYRVDRARREILPGVADVGPYWDVFRMIVCLFSASLPCVFRRCRRGHEFVYVKESSRHLFANVHSEIQRQGDTFPTAFQHSPRPRFYGVDYGRSLPAKDLKNSTSEAANRPECLKRRPTQSAQECLKRRLTICTGGPQEETDTICTRVSQEETDTIYTGGPQEETDTICTGVSQEETDNLHRRASRGDRHNLHKSVSRGD